jgi:transient receptor potential cation channel subfamily M protein 3
MFAAGSQCHIPLVCLVIGGDSDTITAIRDYVMDTPPVPVVVCDGSGRAADLLAKALK